MSNTTTLREACLHDRYDSHALGWLSPELIEPEYIKRQFDGKGWLCDCPGGRERTFKLIREETDDPWDREIWMGPKEYPTRPNVWVEVSDE